MTTKPKICWISDAVVETGFSRVSHNLLGWLGSKWERVVIGVNYRGDPHPYPYKIYPPIVGGDMWGFGRFAEIINAEKPDIIMVQSDAWIVATFVEIARTMENCPPLCAFMPVDAAGVKRSTVEYLSELDLAAFYTQFAVDQAKAAGLKARAVPINLGVRTDLYKPMDRAEARSRLLPDLPPGAFVVGNVNRNQPRKRLDLTIQYFAEWVRRGGDGYLYLHCLREDIGWDLQEIAHYYGVEDRFYMPNASDHSGMLPETVMPIVYSALDVQVSTCMGEGFGLPTLEGMACGTPQILPDFAALGEWPKGAVINVPVEHGQANLGFKSFGVGATPKMEPFIRALDLVAGDANMRAELSARGIARANEERFRWSDIARRFHEEMSAVLSRRSKAAA